MESEKKTEKRKMEKPEIEFIFFDSKDVITTSGGGNDSDGWSGWDHN